MKKTKRDGTFVSILAMDVKIERVEFGAESEAGGDGWGAMCKNLGDGSFIVMLAREGGLKRLYACDFCRV